MWVQKFNIVIRLFTCPACASKPKSSKKPNPAFLNFLNAKKFIFSNLDNYSFLKNIH